MKSAFVFFQFVKFDKANINLVSNAVNALPILRSCFMIKDLFVSSIKRHNYPKTLKLVTGVKGHHLYSILLNKKLARSNSVSLFI